MSSLPTVPPSADLDSGPISRVPWLTSRRLILFVLGWLLLFSAGSLLISNPFQSEVNAGATPNYASVMYLHGLLIGMVGLLALLTCQVLHLRSLHVRVWVTGGVLFATVLSAIGGIFDTRIPGAEIPMWTQILSFFALDEILVVLLIGLVVEWRTTATARTLPSIAAFPAALAMLGAALMGHLAGWIMEFGWNSPPLIKSYATFAGYGNQDDYVGTLVGSHSHEMVVGVMALIILLVARQFGYAAVYGVGRALTRIGVAMVALGTVIMTGMYLVSGFSSWSPPPWFVSGPGGANGIASDDVITGILVMGGGIVILAGLVIGKMRILRDPLRLAALWSWVLSFATVVIAGYAIEMNTVYFGAGDQTARGATNDAVFTWLHQDIGLFLFPTLVLVLLAVERLVNKTRPGWIGWTLIAGTSIAFLGSMIFVFVTPDLHGPGYVITSVGLGVLGLALLATLWWGIRGALVSAVAPISVLHGVYMPPAIPLPSQDRTEHSTVEEREREVVHHRGG